MDTPAQLAATTNALLAHGEPVETNAENAATINAMMGDNPTPGPWGRQPDPWDTPDALDRLP